MNAYLAGLGTAVPNSSVSNAESLHAAQCMCGPFMTDSDWLPSVYEQCGVETRYQVVGRALVEDMLSGRRDSRSPFLPGEHGGPTTAERMAFYAREAPPLALVAAQLAMESSNKHGKAVTHLITISCTGFMAPGIDSHLIRTLPLSPEVHRTHVGFMGCHGVMNGLRIAAAITSADPDAVVLLVAVELCSLHCYYGAEPGKVIANALFGDGAAAVIITGAPTGTSILATGSCLIPDSEREMAWVIGDHGFTMIMTKQIPKLIGTHLRSWLEPWLIQQGYPPELIDHWAVHPGGPKILDAVQEAMTLPHNALVTSREVLKHYGNMSSPTVLFILERLRQRTIPGTTLLLGFGPGMATEAVILKDEG